MLSNDDPSALTECDGDGATNDAGPDETLPEADNVDGGDDDDPTPAHSGRPKFVVCAVADGAFVVVVVLVWSTILVVGYVLCNAITQWTPFRSLTRQSIHVKVSRGTKKNNKWMCLPQYLWSKG